MLESGYVRIYRSFLNWEWYDDSNTMRVFLHLILTANWEPKKWHGITIERGQRVCSYGTLAKELKISEKSVRTAVNHLKQTGEVAHSATPNYGVFTVLNYELYQQPADQAAPDGHPDSMNNLLTDENSAKNGHTNGHTNGIAQTQYASQESAYQKSESALDWADEWHPDGTQAAPDGQQLKKDKESNKEKKDKYKVVFAEYAADDSDLLKALNDFADMRKSIKKPLSTERAAKMLIDKLDRLASDRDTKISILNQSIFKNWQGVFPLKEDFKVAKSDHEPTFDIDEYERQSIYDTQEGTK